MTGISTPLERPVRRRDRRQRAEDLSPLASVSGRPWERIVVYVVLSVLALWWVFPLAVALASSLGFGGLSNYIAVLTQPLNGVYLGVTFLNSAIVALIHAGAVCATSALAGFAFSRLQWRFRDGVFYAVLIFLAVPGTAIIVPVYYLTGSLGMFDTYFAVALPEAALTLPFGVLLVKNFADGLPASMFEAAEVDGANVWQVFTRVYLPQMRSPLINLGILSIMWSFQDFVFPSLLLRNPGLTTASQAVQTIRGAFGGTPQENAQFYAALVLLAVPAIVLVTVGLPWVSRGLTAGGTKE